MFGAVVGIAGEDGRRAGTPRLPGTAACSRRHHRGLAAIIIPDLVSRRFAMSGQPRRLRLASPVEGGILGLMGGVLFYRQ